MTSKILSINNPRHRQSLAMFDFDWTLVKPKSGGTFPKDKDDWQWLYPSVPEIVKDYYKKGYAIVVITNQSKDWKHDQITMVMKSLDIPSKIIIAVDKKDYKPSRKLFDTLIDSKKWNIKKSFYVGDALGRPADFADSDKKFAVNIGVKVHAPEDVFPRSLQKKSVVLTPAKHQEVVIMIGYPGSTKSTVSNKVFGSVGYIVVDGDVYKTVPKMLDIGKEALKNGKSVVFDATNPTKERRSKYIKLAKEFNVPVRCVHVATSMEDSIINNNAREGIKGVPKIVYYIYRKKFEKPEESEGCEVITYL